PPYTVTSSAGPNGTINPNGQQSVPSGGNINFTATPNASYVVNQWLVNGSLAKDGGNNFALNNITSDKTVHVTFSNAPDAQPPSVTITSPADNSVVTSAILAVTGTATDAGRGGNGVSSVTVNGLAASGTAAGSETADWAAEITLSPGANTVSVVAKDAYNNPGQSQITVTYNPLLPGLEWVKIELSAKEEDACAVVDEGAETARIGFDRLDL
ncbi:MAG: hypothetical protein LC775_10515, partial [Acidobacteria bacterium]|nr:hypothetical protein [Acidobacteriota bacterium]